MRRMVDGFIHRAGVHCGSTALADVVRFVGLQWSEPLVFGLGSGIGFYLLPADRPSRVFTGRTGPLEGNFAENTGLDLVERSVREPELAWAEIQELITGGKPVLIKSDIRYLPHYGTDTAFNGHKIVVAGYDLSRDEVYVADTHFEGLQVLSTADLLRTMASDGPPTFWAGCQYATLGRSADERPLAQAIAAAIRGTGFRMSADESGFGGIEALARFAAELPGYRSLGDATWLARFGYQVIERRGSGGGLFRRLFAGFLEEVAGHVPLDASWIPRMHAVADRWTSIAGALFRASEGNDSAWNEASALAQEVSRLERELHAEFAQFGTISG